MALEINSAKLRQTLVQRIPEDPLLKWPVPQPPLSRHMAYWGVHPGEWHWWYGALLTSKQQLQTALMMPALHEVSLAATQRDAQVLSETPMMPKDCNFCFCRPYAR